MEIKKKMKQNQAKIGPTPIFKQEQIFLSFLLLYVLILFSYTLKHQFINYDDPFYIVQNPLIKNLSWEGIKEIFTTPVLGMYNPLPFIVYAIEYALWGLNPKGFHFVNLLFHLIASAACFHFIQRLTGRFGTAMIVAIIFAIHPMHVSVVAWTSQTKTSLYVIFYFIGLIQYLRFKESNKTKPYLLSIVCLIFALLSKPSAVTFAPILLLIDFYSGSKFTPRLILEKVPFFILALGMGYITLLTHTETEDSIFTINKSYSTLEYLLIGNYGLTFYFEKFIAPFNLSMIYPYPKPASSFPLNYYFGLLILPAIGYLIYKAGKFRKDLIFGLCFFLITISIVLRILPAGDFGMGNRYTYLSYTGLSFIVAQLFMNVYDKIYVIKERIRTRIIITGALILVFFSILTIEQVKIWENSVSVFTQVIKNHPHFESGYNQRALALVEKGDYKNAISDLTTVIEMNPSYLDAYLNRGEFKADLQDYTGAIQDFEKCLLINPNEIGSLNNLGQVHLTLGNIEKAFYYLNSALKVNPKSKEVLFNRGLAYAEIGNFDQALIDLQASKNLGFSQASSIIERISLDLKEGRLQQKPTFRPK